MARRSTSALRYAEAVFQVARDNQSFDLWLSELAEAEQLLDDPLAARVLLSPVVPRDRKINIVQQALPGLSAPALRFLTLLIHRERLELVPQIAERLHRLVDQARGVQVAQVTTAVPLQPAERQLLTTRLAAHTGRQIRLEEQVDPNIIGGVVAQIGDEIFDDSVRGRLGRLHRVLVGS